MARTDLVSLDGSRGPDWSAFLELYHAAFTAEEREPDELIAERTRTGRYRLRIARDRRGNVVGCYVVDVVPEEGYALLCYVAVTPAWRKAGVGGRLCRDAVAWFEADRCVDWLLVEAKPRAARLYQRCGFARLSLDYRVPYLDAPGVQPMVLLARTHGGGPPVLEGWRLARMIRHLYVDGYLVAEDDQRLRDQLSRIPEQVRIDDASVQATG